MPFAAAKLKFALDKTVVNLELKFKLLAGGLTATNLTRTAFGVVKFESKFTACGETILRIWF